MATVQFTVVYHGIGALVGVALAMILVTAPAGAQAKKAHGHADTRMPFVHRIFLLDEQGNPIKFRDPKDPTRPNPDARPYSPAMTCGKCHEVSEINHGWHFNYITGTTPKGRPGEPWIWQDPVTRTLLPLSYRGWGGTFDPRKVGISDWAFVKEFGTHIPGGGVGLNPTTRPADAKAHWKQSGHLQIDCMICHSANNNYDPTDRELQLRTENYRYAPTRAYGLAVIRGSVRQVYEDAEAEGTEVEGEQWQKVLYDLSRITSDERVFLDVVAKPPPGACYYCHTTMPAGPNAPPRFHNEEDVHIASGMTCADCHTNGIEHKTVRGYEGEAEDRKEPFVSTLTCAGCHTGTNEGNSTAAALGGRLGSPMPEHKGFPPVHFEKLTCTACHSGPWPEESTKQFQTAMAHKLGLESFTRTKDDFPHIVGPVFLKGEDGKIGPYKMVWPNYWGWMSGDKVEPIDVMKVTAPVRAALASVKTEQKPEPWEALTEQQIAAALEKLAALPAAPAGGAATTQPATQSRQPVYVSGGRVYYRTADGKVTSTGDHPAAQAYSWAMAHDVRPASQSLGIRGCADCHSENAPIYFGNVVTLGPIPDDAKVSNAMHRFRAEDDITIARVFASTFAFRNMLKIVAFASAAVIAAVLLLYFLRGIGYLSSRRR